MYGIEHCLTGSGSMVGLATENASGFGEELNKRFRDRLGRTFRVLCLSKNPRSVLMWGHYTRSHGGIVIGIDPNVAGLHRGIKPDGYEVRYSTDRSLTKLPLAFYQNPQVEMLDSYGNIVNRPDDQVESDGGLVIPFREYSRQVEEAGVTALTTKAHDWQYEHEVRFIYDLSRHSDQLVREDGRCFVSIPKDALREIIVGFQADIQLVREIIALYRKGEIGRPKLFFSECHPYLYEVQAHETDDQYLLDYFQTVLPSM
jgi:hypothetical protein